MHFYALESYNMLPYFLGVCSKICNPTKMYLQLRYSCNFYLHFTTKNVKGVLKYFVFF